ncbi:hypothetical protein SAMN04488516_101423 [Desulfonauticus submarinus]|uniref:Uncharacterized protein n=1 Tax=Desulfonauticus submarinus TaxID=206665 RepID=A0A1H0AIF8_9BACT|nr:hypothetical protein [Desulfonauticus submarinus]SDN33141.1 hypothetical protein SAMN04488516_101423 [Desulfonauticus submarinus]
MKTELIFFPYLHRDYVDAQIRDKGKFLNVGFEDDDENFFTPLNLPFSQKEVHSYLRFCLEFGSQFKNLRDMESYLLQEKFLFDPEGESSLKSELLSLSKDNIKDNKGKKDKLNEAVKYHMVLILFYAYEERIKEIIELEKEVEDKLEKMHTFLGVEDSFKTKDFFSNFIVKYEVKLDTLLPAFDYFLPKEFQLLVVAENVFNELTEMGVRWQSTQDSEELLGEMEVKKGKIRKFIYRKKI